MILNIIRFLLDIGNGEAEVDANGDVEIPDQILLKKTDNIVDQVFGTDIDPNNTEALSKTAILCATNKETLTINDAVLSRIRGNLIDNKDTNLIQH